MCKNQINDRIAIINAISDGYELVPYRGKKPDTPDGVCHPILLVERIFDKHDVTPYLIRIWTKSSFTSEFVMPKDAYESIPSLMSVRFTGAYVYY